MTVSIIIPVYNGQRTIRRCLNSVLKQTYPDIEIVVINDGSTDNSRALIEEMLNSVPNKKVIHKKQNEGIEMARRTGLNMCSGELVTFIDNDDYLNINAIELMVNALTRTNADIVQCQSESFVTLFNCIQLPVSFHKSTNGEEILEQAEIRNMVLPAFFGYGAFNVCVWSKLYRRDLLYNTEPGGLHYGDDLYLNVQVIPKANKLCIIPNILYHYEKQGTSSRYMPFWMEESKRLYGLKLAFAKTLHLDKAYLFCTIELRNCLKSHVESMILHKVDTANGIKQWIANELSDCTYDVFEWLKQQDNCGRSPMSLAIMNKDVDAIYDLARKSVYEWNWKKIARRVLIHIN